MLSVKTVVIIFNLHLCTTGGQRVPLFNLDPIKDFILDIKNSSDSLFEYIVKIQAVFCPDQPICLRDGSKDRNAILETLPFDLPFGTKIPSLGEITDFIGLCCFPCSCFDHCQESNNCCLTKQTTANHTNKSLNVNIISDVLTANNISDISFMNDISDMRSATDMISTTAANITNDKTSEVCRAVETVQNECIVTSLNAYKRMTSDPSYPAYFMIKRCFTDRRNVTLVRTCEIPSVNNLDETVPVTSLKTNRTYWNKHCATCNRDADSALHWESTVVFEHGFVFFSKFSLLKKFPETFDELHYFVVSKGDIIYTPPFSMEDKLCIPKDLLLSCKNPNETNNNKYSIYDDCKQYFNPVSINLFGRVFRYLNIFCFFCDRSEILPSNGDCRWESNLKYSSGAIIGLMNYKSVPRLADNENNEKQLQKEIGKCECNEVQDPVLGKCRPLFCSTGDMMIGCRCIQPIKNLSGMPVRVFLEIAQVSGPLETITSGKVLKVRKALTVFLQNTADNTVAEMVATLRIHSEEGDHLLSVYKISSKWGYDTKQLMKTLARYRLLNNKQEIQIDKTTYYVRLTANASFWDEYRQQLENPNKTSNIIMVYPDYTKFLKNDGAFRSIQILSPLLYCKQVELNNTEYSEKDGLVIVNTTSGQITLQHYYQVSSTQVRVCVNDFLNEQKSGSWEPNYGLWPLNVFLILYHGTFCGLE